MPQLIAATFVRDDRRVPSRLASLALLAGLGVASGCSFGSSAAPVPGIVNSCVSSVDCGSATCVDNACVSATTAPLALAITIASDPADSAAERFAYTVDGITVSGPTTLDLMVPDLADVYGVVAFGGVPVKADVTAYRFGPYGAPAARVRRRFHARVADAEPRGRWKPVPLRAPRRRVGAIRPLRRADRRGRGRLPGFLRSDRRRASRESLPAPPRPGVPRVRCGRRSGARRLHLPELALHRVHGRQEGRLLARGPRRLRRLRRDDLGSAERRRLPRAREASQSQSPGVEPRDDAGGRFVPRPNHARRDGLRSGARRSGRVRPSVDAHSGGGHHPHRWRAVVTVPSITPARYVGTVETFDGQPLAGARSSSPRRPSTRLRRPRTSSTRRRRPTTDRTARRPAPSTWRSCPAPTWSPSDRRPPTRRLRSRR